MPVKKSIYLSKNGKTFGPFSETEIDEFRKKDELNKFQWILHDIKQGWTLIGSPPPLPTVVETSKVSTAEPSGVEHSDSIRVDEPTPAIAAPSLQGKRLARSPERSLPSNAGGVPIAALCQYRNSVLSGSIKDINEEGCTLTEVSPASKTMPLLKEGVSVLLNLLNWETSQSENVSARIIGAIKNKGYWDYRIKWEKIPTLLGNALSSRKEIGI